MEIIQLYEIYKKFPQVETDTRKLKQGDLFFALSGSNFNGNAFAKEALDKGASFAIIDDEKYRCSDQCIVVPDVLVALQALARYHRLQFKIPFIAITGSNGKTTTKELVAAVLAKKYITYATVGNLNNHIGVPLTILKVKGDAQMVIVEMGANHLHEIASYCEIALPAYGIITNCGKAHIEGFGGLEGVRKGKGELYDFIRAHQGTIFRNADLDYLLPMAHDITTQITYGSTSADYQAQPEMNGIFLNLNISVNGINHVINTNLVGGYNFHNVMTAIAVGLHFGVGINDIKDAIANYIPGNSRSQYLKKGSNDIILDAYNANPTSMREAITNFAASPLPEKILWIGGMKEMGKDEREEHGQLVTLIQQYPWKDVILVGVEFKGLQDSYRWFSNSSEAKDYLAAHKPANSSILIKGSRGSRMELLLEAL